MISEKAAWEKDFISTYKDQSDTDKLAEAYKQIQSLIESYKKDLPTEVGVELNANAILNKVLAGAPSKFDDNLINQGAYQDVQFFIDQVKTQKLDDSNLKQFQDMSKEMEERSQKLVVLQSLDSLYNIPKTYEETIGAANKDLGKQLTQKVMRDGFVPVGDLLIRQTVGADGQPQQQILPNYTIYGYEGPKQLPKVKDSDGKEWDLSNFNALAADGGPSTAELQQMVKLAISVLDKDFKKTYDPVNQENREEKIAALDPVAMAKVMQASQGALRSLLSDPQYMAASASDKKYMEQNAMSSGYLVGPTEGGVFGDWHFNQFYTSLKLKEKYDSLEAKGKELNSDGFSNAVGSAVQLYTQGAIYGLGAMAALATGPWAIYLAPKIMEVTQNAVDQTKNIKSDTANFMHENKDTIDAAAAIAAVVTGPVGMVAFAAYKATQGAFEGGALGFVAGAANIGNAYLQGMTGGSLSYEMSYSYKDGFGVSVGGGYRIADGLAIGGSLSYNANSGSINGSVGLQNRFDASGRFTGNLGVNFDNTGFTGVSAGVGIGLGNQDKNGNFAGSLNLGLSYDRNDGFGQSAGISENTNKFAPQSSFDYNHTAWGGNTYSVTTPSVAGITGTYSYNDVTQGYTASLSANSATALTYDSISGDAVYNKGFFGDMGKAQGLALGAMTKDQYDEYVDQKTKKSKQLAEGKEKFAEDWKQSHPDDVNLSTEDILLKNAEEMRALGLQQDGSRIGLWENTSGWLYDKLYSQGGSDNLGYIDSDGKFHVRVCFVAGTLVHIANGTRSIETIQVGDIVFTKSDKTGEHGYKRVIQTFIRQADTIYKVVFVDGSILETTWNHPFRRLKSDSKGQNFGIENSEWRQAKDLQSGDITLIASGETLEIESIEIDNRQETVYNFEVEDFHTYFVGEVGIWVHNDDGYEKYSNKRTIHDEVESKLNVKNQIADTVTGGLLDGVLGTAKEIGKILYTGAKGILGAFGIMLEMGAEGYAMQKKLKEIAETYDTKDAIRLMDDLLMREEKKAKREFNDVNGGLDILIKKRKGFLDSMEGKTTYDTTIGDAVDPSINQKYRDHNDEVALHTNKLRQEKMERDSFNKSYSEKMSLLDQARAFGEEGNYRAMLRTAEKALMYRGHSDGYAEMESIKRFQTMKTVGGFAHQTISESVTKAPNYAINPTLPNIQKAYSDYMQTREENIQNAKKSRCQDRSYNGGYYVVPVCYSY
ncbi:polymorphic toxin-type HINT domain-containing protein [Leptospira koniambonensis]|uniref:polymorphic toxin-type HINT domain-containing protein n=1 Tax=Leptospira koniambonensis TaxID=2484950 RepID=UPI001FC8FEF3|nr:polymorphic toxin-type HINT domain-containing protein [Leptospira koniambonensis]